MGSSANVQQLAPAKHSAAGKSLLRDAIRATTAAVHLKNSVAQTFKEVDDAAPNMICRTPNTSFSESEPPLSPMRMPRTPQRQPPSPRRSGSSS
mmetsp:Transcript_50236/g.132257  ORF Transcript_50236/g.132257 Transcript_50236/m.132257 type:complete len:94 (-) Transcript_50236:337-618(-)